MPTYWPKMILIIDSLKLGKGTPDVSEMLVSFHPLIINAYYLVLNGKTRARQCIKNCSRFIILRTADPITGVDVLIGQSYSLSVLSLVNNH